MRGIKKPSFFNLIPSGVILQNYAKAGVNMRWGTRQTCFHSRKTITGFLLPICLSVFVFLSGLFIFLSVCLSVFINLLFT